MLNITGLHLQYRLWIAEMNADIDVLRILNDYIEIQQTNNDVDLLQHLHHFNNEFCKLRKEIDELRHEMHLNKMKLGVIAKGGHQSMQKIREELHHKTLAQRYETFKKEFSKTKKEFRKFERTQFIN